MEINNIHGIYFGGDIIIKNNILSLMMMFYTISNDLSITGLSTNIITLGGSFIIHSNIFHSKRIILTLTIKNVIN